MKCHECGGKVNEHQMVCENCGLVIEGDQELEYFSSFEHMYPHCQRKSDPYETLIEEIGSELELPLEVRLDAIKILRKVTRAGCFQTGRKRSIWVSTAVIIASARKNYRLNLEKLLKWTKTNQESLLRTINIFALLTTNTYIELSRRPKLSHTKEDARIMKWLRKKEKGKI